MMILRTLRIVNPVEFSIERSTLSGVTMIANISYHSRWMSRVSHYAKLLTLLQLLIRVRRQTPLAQRQKLLTTIVVGS